MRKVRLFMGSAACGGVMQGSGLILRVHEVLSLYYFFNRVRPYLICCWHNNRFSHTRHAGWRRCSTWCSTSMCCILLLKDSQPQIRYRALALGSRVSETPSHRYQPNVTMSTHKIDPTTYIVSYEEQKLRNQAVLFQLRVHS